MSSPTLVPLVAYPDDADVWTVQQSALSTMDDALPAAPQGTPTSTRLPLFGAADADAAATRSDQADTVADGENRVYPANPDVFYASTDAAVAADEGDGNAVVSQPLILPLAHEGIVLGVMVSTREAPPWNREDYQQAERVAKSLAIACVMDQRNQWLQNQLQQRQFTQADQSQTFHDLLHQFRNPLTALQTFGKLLLKRMQSDDPNRTIAEGIVRESGRLRDLAQTFDDAVAQGDADLAETATNPPLEHLLLPASTETFAALEDEDIAPSFSLASSHGSHSLGRTLDLIPGPIAEVVEPLLLSAQTIAQDQDIALIADIPTDLPEVWLDDTALREVVSNLLDNAFKYSPTGTLIWVLGGLVQSLDDALYQGIAIGDTGPGIPSKDQAHIFERHYRGVQAEGQTPGTGLGLAIVKDLVTAMEGHIDVVSPVQFDHWLPLERLPENAGPGSLFIVWLKTV
jgi:hypothetical protein